MLTENEVQSLNAILDRAIAEADDGDPEFQEVAAADVNPFSDTLTQSGVYGDLSTNGLVHCSGPAGEPDKDDEVVEFVCITPTGLEALKSAMGVH